ncbi:MAG: tetratricopeptide repeat protein [Pseudomonadota bacterium]
MIGFGCHSRCPRVPPQLVGGGVVAVLLTFMLLGCASHPVFVPATENLAPLQLPQKNLYAHEVSSSVPDFDLLAVDDGMRDFVRNYADTVYNPRVKLLTLSRAVKSPAILDVQYAPFAEGSAIETFHRGTANCLAFANLFVALAREAGLNANYQWQEVRPQWSRTSDRVQVGLHVNVNVQMSDGASFTVDIDPTPARRITGTRVLSDAEAEALYYNNIAMAALAEGDLETAWMYLISALERASDLSVLWVNLGALYRANDQHRDAEASYLQALALDSRAHSAMTNLAILYGLEGRLKERAFWLDKIDYHRQTNPYYHAWLGDEATAQGDLTLALERYDEAVRLMPSDSSLLYARGVVYYRLNDLEGALSNMRQALDLATRQTDVSFYEIEMARIREEQRKRSVAGRQLSRSS